MAAQAVFFARFGCVLDLKKWSGCPTSIPKRPDRSQRLRTALDCLQSWGVKTGFNFRGVSDVIFLTLKTAKKRVRTVVEVIIYLFLFYILSCFWRDE